VTDPAPPTEQGLRALYEDPAVPIASGPQRARRQLRMIEPTLDAARAAGVRLRIVDIGCGDGAATSELARRARGHTVVGADWSCQALRRARGRGLTVVRAGLDAPGLPFADHSLDVAVLSEVIEHLVDTDAALDEITRVLRPGGSLLLSTPNLAAWFNRALLLGGVQPVFTEVSLRGIYGRPGREVVGHLRVFTRRALTGLLAAHGLRTVELRGAWYHDTPKPLRPLDRLLAHVPSLAADLLVHARTPTTPDDPTPPAWPTLPDTEDRMPLPNELLGLLACPVDKGPLVYDAERDELYNPRLRRRYPIVDGIPHLLADRGESVDAADHHRILARAIPDGLNDVPARK
jgi:SAM-dependent methyltransferase